MPEINCVAPPASTMEKLVRTYWEPERVIMICSGLMRACTNGGDCCASNSKTSVIWRQHSMISCSCKALPVRRMRDNKDSPSIGSKTKKLRPRSLKASQSVGIWGCLPTDVKAIVAVRNVDCITTELLSGSTTSHIITCEAPR